MPCAFGLAASRVPGRRWKTRAANIEGLDAARRQLLADVSQDVDLGALAGLACISPCHFSRQFRQTFGASPRELLQQERLKAARMLLESTSLPVGAIALKVGYASQSTFCRVYRRETGESPSQTREAAKSQIRNN